MFVGSTESWKLEWRNGLSTAFGEGDPFLVRASDDNEIRTATGIHRFSRKKETSSNTCL